MDLEDKLKTLQEIIMEDFDENMMIFKKYLDEIVRKKFNTPLDYSISLYIYGLDPEMRRTSVYRNFLEIFFKELMDNFFPNKLKKVIENKKVIYGEILNMFSEVLENPFLYVVDGVINKFKKDAVIDFKAAHIDLYVDDIDRFLKTISDGVIEYIQENNKNFLILPPILTYIKLLFKKYEVELK